MALCVLLVLLAGLAPTSTSAETESVIAHDGHGNIHINTTYSGGNQSVFINGVDVLHELNSMTQKLRDAENNTGHILRQLASVTQRLYDAEDNIKELQLQVATFTCLVQLVGGCEGAGHETDARFTVGMTGARGSATERAPMGIYCGKTTTIPFTNCQDLGELVELTLETSSSDGALVTSVAVVRQTSSWLSVLDVRSFNRWLDGNTDAPSPCASKWAIAIPSGTITAVRGCGE